MDLLDVEIDRKLFITCRLCLEEDGVYQIVPTVQEQINYCFGIIVEHFDGLPQLLCKKCKLLLNDYASHKKMFIEKQETLKKKLEEKLKKDEDATTKNQDFNSIFDLPLESDSEISTKSRELTQCKRKARVMSSSSSDNESTRTTKKKRKTHKNYQASKAPADWEKDYLKYFTCRFCSKSYKNKKSIYKHCRDRHTNVRSKHRKIIDVKCTVELSKHDNKPNITGLTNTVALRKNKIIQDEGHELYYILYTTVNDNYKDSHSTPFGNASYSSGDEYFPTKNRKRCRLDSKSSTDTVFIGVKNSPNPSENCDSIDGKSSVKNTSDKQSEPYNTICIDDSSDSDVDLKRYSVNETNQMKPTKTEVRRIDEKMINEIISVCRKKYETRRKVQLNGNKASQVDSQLKHKILSIGRKTIGKRVDCHNYTGLLRYLEHKNLNVVWNEQSDLQASFRESNLVQMVIKKGRPNVANDESGWVDLPTHVHNFNKASTSVDSSNKDCETLQGQLMQKSQELQETQDVQRQQMVVQQPPITQDPQNSQHPHMQQPQVVPQPLVVQQAQDVQHPQFVQLPQIVQQLPIIQQPQFVHQQLIIQQSQDQAVLYTNIVDESNTKKLLNPNPVANPKQLPKKISYVGNDTKPILITNNRSINESVIVNIGDQMDESNMVMPVITSTTSLAEVKKDETKPNSNDVNISSNVDKPAPRIKVKPDSELMKPTTLMNVSQPSNIWAYTQIPSKPKISENSFNIIVPNNLVSQIQNQSTPLPSAPLPNNYIPIDKVTSEPKRSSSDFIILDTVDFPNKRTDSPFKYFRDLLLVHDIILIEANTAMSREFICLLKFKVQFKQENKNLTLSLSLFYSDNKFCLCVKDGNLINIQMGKMSANWQWEILKVFHGNVTNRIMQNALKAGPSVHSKTRTFLSLLKSINQKQIE